VSPGEKFLAAVRIALQLLPGGSALAQAISEWEAVRVNTRLEQLEKGFLDRIVEPLAKYGPRAKELSAILYSLIQTQPQDIPTTHLSWNPALEPFKKELRYMDADELLRGSHALGVGGEYKAGFRLNRGFIVYLALVHDDREMIEKLTDALDAAIAPLNGRELQKTIELPLTVIDSFFDDYVNRGQGLKSKAIGSSLYIPKN
jgi:hypothetical protein